MSGFGIIQLWGHCIEDILPVACFERIIFGIKNQRFLLKKKKRVQSRAAKCRPTRPESETLLIQN